MTKSEDTTVLVKALLSADPSELTLDQINRLEGFLNQAKTARLVVSKEYSTLREILSMNATSPASEELVSDVLDVYKNEVGPTSGDRFRDMVERLVEEGTLHSKVLDDLENRDLLPPAKMAAFNEDGFPKETV